MLNEHYDVTTAAYAVGYESYPISAGNICGCLERHQREIIQVAGYRYSTQGFYNLSDSAYSRMSEYLTHRFNGKLLSPLFD